MDLAQESQDPQVQARVWHRSIEVDWMVDPPEEALRRTRSALQVIESLRSLQPAGSAAQAGYFSRWSDTYSFVAGAILREAGRGLDRDVALATAFEMKEHARARALADWLARSDPGREHPETAGTSSLDAVREMLKPQEVLLSFQAAPREDPVGLFAGGSWLLAITRGRVTVHELPHRSDLRNRIRFLEAAITRGAPDRGRELAAAVALYEDLLADALAGLPDGIERLILVPDDALHRLPFAALRASEDGEPLGARYELVQVPSATLWLRWREAEREPAERPLLVLADPALPHGDAAEDGAVQVAQTRGDLPAAETLGRLPWARSEGKAAVRALGGGTLLIDTEASEAALRDLGLGDFEIFHFGAHAVTDEDHPERSAVLLASSPGAGAEGEDGADDPRDGFLRSAEIAHLDLGGRVVVLASCRSAGGSTLRGEGVMSLGRAFFQAGAHGVVASLWPLRDDESAAMFGRFYDHLGRGESVSAALRSARREAIAAGEPAAAWAGLVVLGDGSVVPLPGGRSLLDHPALPVVAAALLVLAAGLLAAFAVRRRRARAAGSAA
jgi:CHAT domain-containing protein